MSDYTVTSKQIAAICHFGSLFAPLLIPIIILIIKNDDEFISYHAKQCLVWQIGMGLITIVSIFTIIGVFIFPIVAFIFTIIAGVRALEGDWYSYPVLGSLVKKPGYF